LFLKTASATPMAPWLPKLQSSKYTYLIESEKA
jgi:hypothetical protein